MEQIAFNLTGSFFDSSGYSNHLRGLANGLSKLARVRISTNFVPNWEKVVTDKELEMLKREPEDNEINIIITPPVAWKLSLGRRNWAYCIFEGDKVPECFIEEFANPEIERILIPSIHTQNAIMKTLHEGGLQNPFKKGIQIPKGLANPLNDIIIPKIKIIPHGVDLNLFYPKKTEKKKFTFLMNKGFRNSEDRGGIQYGIKAFCEEFNKEENVELIVKINPAYGIPDLNKIIKELDIQNKEFPPIKFITNYFEYNKLVDLYNSADVFVSPTRAEAFNIPCLEAFACGIPVTTTEFGGQTDYCNEDNSWIIKGELKEVEHEIQYEGIKWLTPDIKQLRETMRYCYNDPEICRLKGCNGQITASKMTWEDSAKKLMEVLNGME